VSAFHWDQNEIFSQFSGDHTFVQYGFGTLLAALAEGLDIKFNSPVKMTLFNNLLQTIILSELSYLLTEVH